MTIHAQEEVRGELTSKEVAPTVGTPIELIHHRNCADDGSLIGLIEVVGSPPATGVLLLSELPHRHLVIGLAQAKSCIFPVTSSLGITGANSYVSSSHETTEMTSKAAASRPSRKTHDFVLACASRSFRYVCCNFS